MRQKVVRIPKSTTGHVRNVTARFRHSAAFSTHTREKSILS